MRVAGSPFDSQVGTGRSGRGRRRVAFVLLVALGLVVAVPPGTLPRSGEFPVSWLWSWLGQRPAWAGFASSAFEGLAVQGDALGRDDEHYVSTGQTRAAGGAGGDAGRAPGALDPAPAPRAPAAEPWTAPELVRPGRFNPDTSVKVSGLSTATSDTYRNADGSYTRRVANGPTNFRAADGSWRPIDTRWVSRGGRLHPAANSIDVSVAGRAGSGRAGADSLASVRLAAGQMVSFGLQGAAPVEAVVDGSTVTFRDVLADTDLEYVASGSALKETLILKSPDAASSWVFPLTLQGLTPRLAKDGSVELTDGSGQMVGQIPAGFMSDSTFDPERGEMTSSTNVTYELVSVDGARALRVSADRDWLRDPARVYPVRVDPSAAFYVNDDVFVDNDASTNSSHHNGVDRTVGTFNNGTTVARSFLNVDSFGGVGLTGHKIVAARLQLFVSWTYDCLNPRQVNVHRVTSPWSVAGLASSGLWGPSVSGPIGWATPGDNYPACTNTSANRSVGEWMTVWMDPATFNDWSVNPGSNFGLALIANEESGTNSKYGWKRFTSRNYGDGSLGPIVEVDFLDVAPQVNAQYPPSNSAASTLTPELIADAVDPDAFPHPLTYNFLVYDKTATKIAESGPISSRSWVVPAGKLAWGEAYVWTVVASDGLSGSSSQTMNVLSTAVPQPLVTSALAQNGGQGFSPGAGNYTTSATDAAVASVGPALSVRRSYNSADPRVGAVFGAGWSSLFDARVTERTDTQGVVATVVVTYPTGQEVAFGRNANATFTPPSGRFATFTTVAGGYKLVDKDGAAYTFTAASGVAGQFGLASVADPQGRAQTFTFDPSGQITTATSASGRALHLTWSTPAGATRPHVATVSTDPATPGVAGTAATWTYTYSGDLLAKVCPPTSASACTTYTHTVGSLYPSTVLNAGPRSYWRLGEPAGTVAASAVIDQAGADNATYANVSLGQPGPLPGSTATAAGFNGSSSSLVLPTTVLTSASYVAVSMWFKTTVAGGILLAQSNQPWNSPTAPSHTATPLYVGTDGKLHANFYTGASGQIVSTQNVNDGQWHHVVLSGAGNSQSLYLDGTAVAGSPLTGVVTHLDMGHASVGAGYSSGIWPAQPAAGWRSFNGSIADVAVFDRPLTAVAVATIRATGTDAAHPLTSVLRPSGNPSASVAYNAATGAVTQVSDANGGVWQLPDPTVSGSYQVHASSVLAAGPWDYWRLAETGTTQAVNQVNGNAASYSGVTLGVDGGPFDEPPAVSSFDGSSSFVALPAPNVPTTGPHSVSLWFKMTAASSAGGVLFGVSSSQLPSSASAQWLPALYVGTDGKLRGQFWNGAAAPIATTATVNDGRWHHAALAASTNSQSLYLDGVKVATKSGNLAPQGSYAHLGEGKWQGWPGASAALLGHWPGQIGGFAFQPVQWSDEQVAAQFATRVASPVASFNGTSSYLKLPTSDIPTTGPTSVSMWFKMPAGASAGGVLFSYQTTQVPTVASTGWTPALYVGTDGRLRGEFWYGTKVPIATGGTVNDGAWHHVVLAASGSSQALYLDGVKVGTLNVNMVSQGETHAHVGAGQWLSWPGASAATIGYWPGQIAEVAYYRSQLSDPQVSAQYNARVKSSGAPVKTVTVTGPGSQATKTVLDVATGRKVAEVDALGNTTQYGYDTGGFLHRVIDPNGNVSTTEQDVRGNTVSSKTCQKLSTGSCSTVFFTYHPDATTRNLTPDPRNDVMLTMRDARSSSAADNTYKTTYTFDAAGNRTSVTDPLNRVTATAYTTATTPASGGGVTKPGLPATLTTPGGAIQNVEYLSNGDVAKVTDPAGKITTLSYDGLGRVLTRTETTGAFPTGLTTTLSYDLLGRVVSHSAPAVTNRVTGAVHTPVTTTAYDVDGHTLSQTVTDTSGGDAPRTVSWTYNTSGQQVTATDPAGKTSTVEYDLHGRVVKEIGADGVVVATAFDAKGQLLTTKVKNFTGDPNSPTAPSDLPVTSKAYDPAGRVASVTDAMGWQSLYTYTDNNLVAKVTRKDPSTGATFGQLETTYDAAGNVTMTKTNNGVTSTTYVIDNAGRTTSSTLDPGGLARTTTQTLSPDDHVLNTTRSDATGVLASTDTIYDPLGRALATSRANAPLAPVGRWRLNESTGTTAADNAGNSAGALTSGVAWSADHGGSAVFSGSATRITTTDPVVDTERDFTVAAWFYLTDNSELKKALGTVGAQQNSFDLRYDAGKWRFATRANDVLGASSVVAASTTTAALNTWTHLVGTYEALTGTMRVYVNGVLEGTATGAKPFTARKQMVIGAGVWDGSYGNHWKGSIDDVQLYQQTLSGTQVAGVYSGAAPAAGASVVRTSWKLDQSGLATAQTDPNGNTTDYSLDEAGRVAVVSAPAVLTETGGATPLLTRPVSYTGYDTFGAVVESKDANGNVSVFGYDAAGRVTSTTRPNYTPPGSSTPIIAVSTRSYDDVGQLATSTDPLGHPTSYLHDQLGRVAKVTAADLGVTTYGYDLVGDQLSVTDPTGAVATATYDHLGRQLTSTQVVRQSGANYQTSHTYGTGGWLSATQSPAGVTSSTTYNPAGQPLTVTDGAGNATTHTYDGVGRRTRTTLADNTYSTLSYDLAGRVSATSTYDAVNTLLSTRSAGHDAAGNVTASTDARGTTSTFTYDATGLLSSQLQPISGSDAITTSLGHDLAGHQTRFTDGRANAFITTYNSWGLPESRMEPATPAYPGLADRSFTTGYDAAGRVASGLEPGGVAVTHSYDPVGRLTGQTGAGAEVATSARTFGYDLAGRLTSASGPGGTNTLTYDDRGLLLSTAGGSGTSWFGYTNDGRMSSRTDAAGTTSYTYDGAGRLASAANPGTNVAAALTYNSLSQPSKITYGSGGNARWLGYDSSHRLTADELKTPGGASIAKITYGWDSNGNETTKTTTGFASSAANTYTYDLANRLTSWDNGVTPTVYGYDKSGNRVQAGANLFTHDERNQLKTASGGLVYSYTPRGTLSAATTVGVSTVATRADAYGQVRTQYVTPTQQQDYDYDGLGRLVAPGAAYTGVGNTLAADDTSTYTRDPSGGLLGAAAGGSQRLAWTDLHTDVVAQFDPTGTTLAGSTGYDPLGNVLATAAMVGALGYQSEHTDAATGRVNMHARWYNPVTGSFDTRDSLDVSAVPASMSANKFAYANANPLTHTDPTGHCSLMDLACHARTAAAKVAQGYNAVKTTVVNAWNATLNWATERLDDARSWAKEKLEQGRRVIDQGRQLVDQGKKWVGEQVDKGRQRVAQAYNQVKQAGTQLVTQATRVITQAVTTVKDAYQAAQTWVVEHKDIIVEVAAIAGAVLAGIACTAVTAGVAAVGCMIGAAALINLAKDFGQGDIHNVGDGLRSFGTGALQGALGGVGGALGGFVAGKAAGALGGWAASVGGRMLAGGLSGAVGDAATQMLGTGRVDLASLATSAGIGIAFGGLYKGGAGKPGAKTSCERHSFKPGTRVLMADATTRPIEDVNIGDNVKATDPTTGKTQAKPVTMLHLNNDRDLTTITIAGKTGTVGAGPTLTSTARTLAAAVAVAAAAAGILHTTQNHPIWDQTTTTWTHAADLKPGQSTLLSPDGTTQQVVAVNNHTGHQNMRDLTIADTHTYYVLAGDSPVLVHNCGPDLDALSPSAKNPVNPRAPGGDSNASRAYQKHMGRPNTTLIEIPSGVERKDIANYLVDDLLTNPKTALQSFTHQDFGPVYDFRLPDIGARWSQAGDFIGFLD